MGELYLAGAFAWERFDGMDGFVLADTFDDVLRQVGEGYLVGLWTGLAAVLEANGMDPGVLAWGSGHPGYTSADDWVDSDSAVAFFGWVMPSDRRRGQSLWQAEDPGLTVLGEAIAADLRRTGLPLAIAGADLRSFRAHRVVDGVGLEPVAPDDIGAGLALLVDECTDLADWAPGRYAGWAGEEICGPVADAIAERDVVGLVTALEAARASCGPVGYQIVAQGFAGFMVHWLPDDAPGLAPRADPTPALTVDIAEHLRMVVRPYRRSSWLSVQLSADGAEGRYAPVHVDRLVDFVAALGEVASGQAESATLASLGRASGLIVGPRTVSGHLDMGHHDPPHIFSVPTPPTTPGRLYAALRPHRTAWSDETGAIGPQAAV